MHIRLDARAYSGVCVCAPKVCSSIRLCKELLFAVIALLMWKNENECQHQSNLTEEHIFENIVNIEWERARARLCVCVRILVWVKNIWNLNRGQHKHFVPIYASRIVYVATLITIGYNNVRAHVLSMQNKLWVFSTLSIWMSFCWYLLDITQW